jgi:cobalt-zinc-cadmium efflux system outer membrane protein
MFAMRRTVRANGRYPLALLLLVLGGSAGAQPAPPDASLDAIPSELSLPKAEELFLVRGLDLLIAEYGAEGAEGDLRAAGAHPNPGLNLDGFYGPQTQKDVLNGPLGNNATQTNLGFSAGLSDNAALEDQLSGKRSLRIEAAAKALAAARLNVDDVRRTELSQLRQAYVAAVMAKLNVDAARDAFDTYDKQLKLNQRRYDEGAINGLDLSRVLQAQLEGLQALDSAQAGLKQAMASLMFLLGVRGGLPTVALTTGIDFAPLKEIKEATVSSLHELALKNRTDVKIAVANLEQAEVMVRQAKRARLPDIALSLGYSEQCNSQTCSSAPSFQAGLQGNLPVLYQQQGEIKRAESNALTAGRALDKAKAQVLSDVTQSYASYAAAASQVQRMESKLLDQAKLSRDLAQAMYQKGAASFIDFMDAQRTYVASVLEYHQDLATYWSAVYQLEQSTGTSLR